MRRLTASLAISALLAVCVLTLQVPRVSAASHVSVPFPIKVFKTVPLHGKNKKILTFVNPISITVWPDGQPVSNAHMSFLLSSGDGNHTGLIIHAARKLSSPDYARCLTVCQPCVGGTPAQVTLNRFILRIRVSERDCLLPRAANPNAQIWRDIQLNANSPARLSVPGSDNVS